MKRDIVDRMQNTTGKRNIDRQIFDTQDAIAQVGLLVAVFRRGDVTHAVSHQIDRKDKQEQCNSGDGDQP